MAGIGSRFCAEVTAKGDEQTLKANKAREKGSNGAVRNFLFCSSVRNIGCLAGFRKMKGKLVNWTRGLRKGRKGWRKAPKPMKSSFINLYNVFAKVCRLC